VTSVQEAGPVTVYLHAGQVFASAEPCEISTILGSCVAVLLVDPVKRIGGASHYLLPFCASPERATLRFGNAAIAELLSRMLALGSRKADLCAKIFGGASTLAQGRPGVPSLGAQNVDVARTMLGAEGIPILAQDVGGIAGRKVVFRTDEGHVWVKRL
jgi:chemotaxis protein CheD